MKLPEYCLDKNYPNHFRLGFTGFIYEELKDIEGDTIELKVVPSKSSEAKMPTGWTEKPGYAAFIDCNGRIIGAISDITFFKTRLHFGDTVNCRIRRLDNRIDIFAPIAVKKT